MTAIASRTVFVIDDDAGFRTMARSVLEACGMCVVGEAGDGLSGIEAIETLQPAVVLVDIRLPDIDGIEVARRLGSLPDQPVVILVSSRDAADYGGRLVDSGARGFIQKARLSRRTLERLMT
jgi:DNA-binding NarL/FixJ family response regulator